MSRAPSSADRSARLALSDRAQPGFDVPPPSGRSFSLARAWSRRRSCLGDRTSRLASRQERPFAPPNQSEQALSPPPGYTNQQLILADQFSGTALDTQKWSTYVGTQGIIWNNHGLLPAPYSGPNASAVGSEAAMFGPSQVSVHNGLTLTAEANTTRFAQTYPWISGVATTENKFSLPATGWYVQVKAKMPDMTAGCGRLSGSRPLHRPVQHLRSISLRADGSRPIRTRRCTPTMAATQASTRAIATLSMTLERTLLRDTTFTGFSTSPTCRSSISSTASWCLNSCLRIKAASLQARTNSSYSCRSHHRRHRGGIPFRQEPPHRKPWTSPRCKRIPKSRD